MILLDIAELMRPLTMSPTQTNFTSPSAPTTLSLIRDSGLSSGCSHSRTVKSPMVLFRMGYEAVCGGEFTSPSGVVSSPYHPQSYPRSHHSHGDNHNVQLDDYEDKCEETNMRLF